MSQYLFLLLLCLSMHACNARCLLVHVSTKGVEMENLEKTLIPLEQMPSISEKLMKTQEQQEVKFNARKFLEGLFGAILKGSKNFSKDEDSTKEATSGNRIIVSPPNNFHGAAKIEGFKSQERSLLSNDNKENVDSKEDDTMEDVVVMDYAQPHRKPPIHNEKP